jgi:hypothetical protein
MLLAMGLRVTYYFCGHVIWTDNKPMPHTIEYNDAGYIYVTYEGNFDIEGALELLNHVASSMREHNCYRVLADFRNATMNISTLHIYNLPKLLQNQAVKADISFHHLKRAMIVPALHIENFRFFETVSSNRMQVIRVFQDLDEARAWLLAD